MVRRCVVGGCSNVHGQVVRLYGWPSDEIQARKWDSFVKLTRKDFVRSSSSQICCGHFQTCDFENMTEWMNGFASSLHLRKDTVVIPSVKTADLAVFHHRKQKRPAEDGDENYLTSYRMEDSRPVVKKRNVNMLVEEKKKADKAAKHQELAEAFNTRCKSVQTKRAESGTSVHTQTDFNQNARSTQTSGQGKTKGTQTDVDFLCHCCEADMFTVKDEDRHDPDFEPSCCDHPPKTNPEPKERWYIVSRAKLLSLFSLCFICQAPSSVTVKENGTAVNIKQTCTSCSSHKKDWYSQPYIRQMPVCNLLMSAAILISGCVISKALRLFDYLNVAMISRSTFYRHQRKYLWPHVLSTWSTQQEELLTTARQMESGLHLSGDGRCDSPGHCAKYGSYTVIETSMNKVLVSEMVQSNEVKSSYHMELEGLKRVVAKIGADHIREMVTDRHRSIAKWIREELPKVLHLYDVWHVARSI